MNSKIDRMKSAKKYFITENEVKCHHFDEKMLDFVSILTVHGFQVIDFCEGHLDEIKEPDINMVDKIPNLNKRIQKAHNFYPYVRFTINKVSSKSMLNFMDILEKFYKDRPTEYKHTLTIGDYDLKDFIIKPLSGDVSSLITDKKEQEKLHTLYHKEINDFVEFYKKEDIKKG
jgi:hypothetical protein